VCVCVYLIVCCLQTSRMRPPNPEFEWWAKENKIASDVVLQ
jgi:hypothetical protein